MAPPSGLRVRGRRWIAVATAALVFLAAWLILCPASPWEADADVYDSLFAARNLIGGHGLSVDVVHPMSTVFPWGRALPQPLLERPPGLALLFAPALLAAGGDPARAPAAVRTVQLVLLMVTVIVGLLALRKRDGASAGPAWLLLLLINPQLGLAVNWGWVEVSCGLLLLLLWLRLRERDPLAAGRSAAAIDGLLAGLLSLMRTDLTWIPALWWLAAAARSPDVRRLGRAVVINVALSVGVWLLVTLPWWIHVAVAAGSPLFNPLSYALQFSLSEQDYARLRGLEPVPLLANLHENLGPALLKLRHGVWWFAQRLGKWLPWPVWGVGGLLMIARWSRRRRSGAEPTRSQGSNSSTGPTASSGSMASAGPTASSGSMASAGPTASLGLLSVTLAGAIVFYSLTSQEVRHLLVFLPLLAWEIALLADSWMRRGSPALRRGLVRALVLAAAAGLAIVIAPARLGLVDAQVALAREQAPRLAALAREVQSWPPGPIFTDNAAVCWYTRRTGVWQPYDARVEATIREAIPGMHDARWARLQ